MNWRTGGPGSYCGQLGQELGFIDFCSSKVSWYQTHNSLYVLTNYCIYKKPLSALFGMLGAPTLWGEKLPGGRRLLIVLSSELSCSPCCESLMCQKFKRKTSFFPSHPSSTSSSPMSICYNLWRCAHGLKTDHDKAQLKNRVILCDASHKREQPNLHWPLTALIFVFSAAVLHGVSMPAYPTIKM